MPSRHAINLQHRTVRLKASSISGIEFEVCISLCPATNGIVAEQSERHNVQGRGNLVCCTPGRHLHHDKAGRKAGCRKRGIFLLQAGTGAGDIPDGSRETQIMVYYVSKAFWLIAAPTSALVLISAIAALWAVLGSSKCAAWLAAAAACGLVIGAFTPIGVALLFPLEHRFMAFSAPDSQAPPDGIIVLAGAGDAGIDAVSALSREYPKARLTFSGFRATALERFARLGGDPARVYVESRPRTTSEDALYSAALLKPKPSERWLLVTLASHMPRAVGCFRVAGFEVEPHPVGFRTGGPSHLFSLDSTGSAAFFQLDVAAKEWIGLIAYGLMGKTDALFPAP